MSEPTPSDEIEEAIFYALREHFTMTEACQILADEPELDDGTILALRNIASDVRAALTPPVAPLASGETVTIPTTNGFDTGGVRCMANRDVFALTFRDVDGILTPRFLDLAGVRQLEATCRRARSAMEMA